MDSTASVRRKPTVVGIGASAGGLAALKLLFDGIPPNSGLAFVVVVHLSPEHKSHLAELLQPHVPFSVQQVTEDTPLEANNVYIIPPNANLTAIDTHVRLSKLEEQRRQRAPIDYFFRTLASAQDGHSIAVILTGTGSDGTLGIKEIKSRGGTVFVQDPNEAEYDGMPQSAIASGMVDRVLPIGEIAQALLRIDSTDPKVGASRVGGDSISDGEAFTVQRVLTQLRARTDRDFSRYKQSTMLRRIARRMQLNYIEDPQVYVEKLRETPEEVRALADDLLITVTSFFRDSEVFEHLSQEVIPALFEGKGLDDSIRVWSVGCATGEEAYSLAILLCEESARREVKPRIQVFASDLHRKSLDKAREGFYPGDIETDVSDERLQRFFQKEDGGFRIRKEVRDLVVFAPHNLLSDPPFSRIDLISCRNLLIYLQRGVQRDVIELFHYALKPEGVLMLGSAESADAQDIFRTESKRLCFYRKRNVLGPEPRLPVFPLNPGRRIDHHIERTRAEDSELLAYGTIHHLLLDRFGPPSLLISPDNRIVHLSEQAGRYLLHPGGELTAHAFKLLREELRLELQAALQEARENRQSVTVGPIQMQIDGRATPVLMHVRPAQQAQQDGFALIIFDEREVSVDLERLQPQTVLLGRDGYPSRDMEGELSRANQRLQTTVEEYETSREEMRAANEEMQSTNEELRSTLEELETSKEELQSINEELQTVNQENRHKVEESSQLNTDLQNLLAATDIATLFLDRGLRILRFTPAVSRLFNIRSTDRGRPILDLTHKLRYPELRSDAESVLERLIPVEREVKDEAGGWYLTRVLPYRSQEDRIEGLVVTLVDITARKRAEAAVRASEERLQRVLETEAVGVLFFDHGGAVVGANDVFLKMTGYTRAEIDSRELTWKRMSPPEWLGAVEEQFEKVVATGRIGPYEREYLRRDGSRIWMLFAGRDLGDGTISEFCIDVTDRKLAEAALRESEERFRLLVENVQEYALFQADAKGHITSWNPGAERLFGYTTSEVLGQLGQRLLTKDDQDAQILEREIAIVVAGERQQDARWMVRKDGSQFWAQWVTEPVRDENGNLRGVAKILRDETDRMRTEAALRNSLGEKEALLNEVHHRVKNNLQVITSLLNLQAMQIKDEQALAQFDVARNRVQSIASIHELLYRSASFTSIDLGTYAKRLVEDVIQLYGAGNRIAIRVDSDRTSLELERAVPFGLLLNELVSNVCKHAFPKEERGTLTVTIGREGEHLNLTVADSGGGLPDHSDGENTTSIGLFLVRRLAKQLHGTVAVESSPEGTTAHVSLPVTVSREYEDKQ